MAARFTLDELTERLRVAIAEVGLTPLNGQVQAVPDRRTLRYYTTLGLLDRPLAMRARQAVYGERHLLQALAIKRLQAEGLGLAAVQRRLAGLPDDELRAIAWPDRTGPDATGASDATGAPPPASDRRFWADHPGTSVPAAAIHAERASVAPAAGPAAQVASVAGPARSASRAAPAARPASVAGLAQLLAAVPLGEGVVVLVPAARPFDPGDVEAVRAAALPLLDHLRRTGALPRGYPPEERT